MQRVLAVLTAAVVILAACGDGSGPRARQDDDTTADAGSPFTEALADDRRPYGEVVDEARTAIEAYWAEQYATIYGTPYRAVADARAMRPGDEVVCNGSPNAYRDVKGKVLYCADEDVVLYDDARLLPELHEHFGALAVSAVLARGWGRAIQTRSGFAATGPAPVVALQADCLAGAWAGRAPADGSDPGHARLDAALAGYLLVSHDPTGEPASEVPVAAFDRVQAFREGLAGGPGPCVAYADPSRRPDAAEIQVTERGGSASHSRFGEMVDALADDLDLYWAIRVSGFEPVVGAEHLDAAGTARCDDEVWGRVDVDPVAYCAPEHRVLFDDAMLASGGRVIGDGFAMAALSDAWARAAAVALGFSIDPTEDGLAFDCLSGTWAGDVVTRPRPDGVVAMTVRKLDGMVSAVLVLRALGSDRAGLDAFDRVEAFRAGFRAVTDDTSGPADACRRFL